jgi:hypothetical protein
VSARVLFGAPSGWCERNGGALVAAVMVLAALADWLADVAGAAVASLP